MKKFLTVTYFVLTILVVLAFSLFTAFNWKTVKPIIGEYFGQAENETPGNEPGKDENLTSAIEELNKLKEQLQEALNDNTTLQETIDNLKEQIKQLETQIEESQGNSLVTDFILNNDNLEIFNLNNKVYFSGVYLEGIYCLDETGFKQVYSQGIGWVNSSNNENYICLGSSSGDGVVIIKPDGSINLVSNTASNMNIYSANENAMLVVLGGNEISSNFQVLDLNTFELTNLNLDSNLFYNNVRLNNSLIVLSGMQEGLYLVDINEKTATLIYETGTNWSVQGGNDTNLYAFINDSNTLLGINTDTKTVTDTYSDEHSYYSVYQDEQGIDFQADDGITIVRFSFETGTFEKQNSFESIIAQVKQGTKTTLTYADFEGVTEIPSNAFEDCTALTSVEIPNTITSIGSYAFNRCTGLTSLTFQENSNLTEINTGAFSSCSNLTTLRIPASVTGIYISTFGGCSNLSEVIFEEGSQLQKLGASAFSGTKITEITLPGNLNTFQGLDNNEYLQTVTFTSDLVLHGNLNTWSTFDDCPALTTIYVPSASLEEFKTVLSEYADLFVGV